MTIIKWTGIEAAALRAALWDTQVQFAERIGCSVDAVGKWERNGAAITLRPKYSECMNTSYRKLDDKQLAHFDAALRDRRGFGLPDREHSVRIGTLDSAWSIRATMQVLHEVAEGSMDRREFLTITGGALTGLGSQWDSALGGTTPSQHTQHHDRLSAGALDCLDDRLAGLRRLDDEFGGRELHPLAVAEFRWLTRLADESDYGSQPHRLFSLVTEAARLCGWLHFDAGHHAAAQSYYVAALHASASAKDPLTGAHVLACMAFQAMLTDHCQEAVALIDAAEQRTARAASPRLRALLASRKARAYAKAGDALSCGRALNEAERQFDTATSGTVEPDWIYYFDEAELTAQAAACWVDLRRPKAARPLIDTALSSIDPSYVRDRTIYHVRSAEAHLHAGNLELACTDLHSAAALARRTGSVRSIRTIRSAREALSRYDREPRVQQLDRYLAGLVA
ncbi:helix-turn-helix domain-containing protein [Nocardia carnea]|uniref:helix-turn-helix domain-containing protein n=1 Tax=Nocardia carnea TaxID=37328 RepID=UPI0024587646|nr:helix-turn-helix transcriptional regulator [Nocardia carnea]